MHFSPKDFFRIFTPAGLLLASFSLISCSTIEPVRQPEPIDQARLDAQRRAAAEADFNWWEAQRVQGPASIVIDLSDQAAYVYKAGKIVGRTRVATGNPTHPTPVGSFKVTEKVVDKRSSHYGWMYDANENVVNYDADLRKDPIPPGGRYEGADMPYWMRLTNTGIGMHAGFIPDPGKPASHGCIRLAKPMAERIFSVVNVGTPVRVQR